MTDPAGKPIPVADQDSAGYWAAVADHRLVVQHCKSCGHRQLYPRLYCTVCHSTGVDLELEDVDGSGEVYATTVVRRAPTAAFAADVPYCIALIRLAEGPLIMANVVGCEPDEVVINLPVQVDFGDARGDTVVPRFRPITET
ncbi:MAG: uncharacterized protein QOH89_1039 [Pseudonocardiales bacterium]|jgi:uncharacterized OB-fold protein|nr:uncharacterized protein [Pseudonocardiales bacterium]MDT4943259.1 uncharacterized protein [Pseudonocardiales bacterium]